MINAAWHPELACLSKKFVDLLGKIETVENQEKAITNGIRRLLGIKQVMIALMILVALEGVKFPSKDLNDIATQTVFVAGAAYNNEIWTKKSLQSS